MATNVLVIGGGAREHAFAWKLRQSPRLGDLTVAPGNAGIAGIADVAPLSVPKPHAPQAQVDRFLDDAARLARDVRADLVVVASDDPLSFGLVDRIESQGIAAFGPTKAAAEIEWSKAFGKELIRKHGIPAGGWARFSTTSPQRART
jgi:phosphoribosylamine--glycine ligase